MQRLSFLDDVPVEVWISVISLTDNSTHATLARVNKSFNAISIPVLYGKVALATKFRVDQFFQSFENASKRKLEALKYVNEILLSLYWNMESDEPADPIQWDGTIVYMPNLQSVILTSPTAPRGAAHIEISDPMCLFHLFSQSRSLSFRMPDEIKGFRIWELRRACYEALKSWKLLSTFSMYGLACDVDDDVSLFGIPPECTSLRVFRNRRGKHTDKALIGPFYSSLINAHPALESIVAVVEDEQHLASAKGTWLKHEDENVKKILSFELLKGTDEWTWEALDLTL